MPQTFDMVAIEDVQLTDRLVPKGRRFTASLVDAAVLKYHQRARFATDADPIDEAPVSRRRYRRRDLQADS